MTHPLSQNLARAVLERKAAQLTPAMLDAISWGWPVIRDELRAGEVARAHHLAREILDRIEPADVAIFQSRIHALEGTLQ